MTRDQFELLTQDSDVDSIKAAITAGADAVYCELNRFAYPDWYTVAISTNHQSVQTTSQLTFGHFLVRVIT